MFKFSKKKAKKRKKGEQVSEEAVIKGHKKEREVKDFGYDVNHKYSKRFAPDGLNGDNNSFLIISDAGKNVYIRTFYISDIKKRVNFANTFVGIMNFPDSAVSIFVNPMVQGKADKSLESDVTNVEAELISAKKNHETNRARKLTGKFNTANRWAEKVESGDTALYEVAIMISIYADDLKQLDKRCGDFYYGAMSSGLKLANCWGFQLEAYMANQPLNRLSKFISKRVDGTRKPVGVVYHRFDSESIATFYNHLYSEFYHPDGIYLGYTLPHRSPLIHNVYDPSHKGYGVVVGGSTGSGKSVAVKTYVSRWIPFGYRFVMLDSDSTTGRGEYALTAEENGGVNFLFAPGSKEIMNIYELKEEEEIDTISQELRMTVKLKEKINSASNMIMSIMEKGEADRLGDNKLFVESIIREINTELYREIGIEEGDPDSLFEKGDNVYKDGSLTSGKQRKRLPTISKFYVKLIIHRKYYAKSETVRAYEILLSGLKDYVRDLIVCSECGHVYTKDEYDALDKYTEALSDKKCNAGDCKGRVMHILGNNPYYDGESTIEIDLSVPVTNLDISQLPDAEKPIGQEVALIFIKENFIKKNSVIPSKAMKLGVIYDELHKLLPFESARRLAIDTYRTGRKRFVSPITATQSIGDYALYDEETLAMVKNSSTMFIMAHKTADKNALANTTILTPAQIDKVTSFSIGECYLIDGETVVHGKIDYMKDIEGTFAETNLENIKVIDKKKVS